MPKLVLDLIFSSTFSSTLRDIVDVQVLEPGDEVDVRDGHLSPPSPAAGRSRSRVNFTCKCGFWFILISKMLFFSNCLTLLRKYIGLDDRGRSLGDEDEHQVGIRALPQDLVMMEALPVFVGTVRKTESNFSMKISTMEE